jgi:formylglycine-generating enzyme required for sulfatase activity
MKLAALALTALVLCASAASAAPLRCPADSVAVGPVCIDRWEASVWEIPESNRALIARVQRGRVTKEQLIAGGAVQVSAMTEGTCAEVSYPPTFPVDGAWTKPLYAVSVPGVLPTTCTSWFQAQQACRLSGKRLLTNEEWQAAAAGTPDPGILDDQTTTCAVASPFGVLTGSRSACRSSWGVHDMVGNAWEWVAEWGEMATGCGRWLPEMGDDLSCIGRGEDLEGTASWPSSRPRHGLFRQASFRLIEDPTPGPNTPSGLIRGGNFGIQDRSGVFAFYQSIPPTTRSRSTGFRCAR